MIKECLAVVVVSNNAVKILVFDFSNKLYAVTNYNICFVNSINCVKSMYLESSKFYYWHAETYSVCFMR